MNKVDKIKINKLIHTIGLKYGLTDQQVKEIVESQFEFTAEKLKEINLDTVTNDEDIDKIKGTFLYKGFGKLHLSPQSIRNYLKRKKEWKK